MAAVAVDIHVTEHHINTGKPQDCLRCPVALAIEEAVSRLGLHVDEVAGVDCSYVLSDGRQRDLPDDVFLWILQFDAGVPVEPLDFRLEWDDT